jgi:signal transduction histidine kinase
MLTSVCLPSSLLGVRAKLLGGFLAIALFAAVLGGYTVVTIERLSASQRTVVGDVFGGTQMLANWVDRSWETRRDVLAYAFAENPEERAALRGKIVAQDTELEQLALRMDEADTDREDVQTLARLKAAWWAYADWRDSAIAESDASNDRGILLDTYRSEGTRLSVALDQAIDEYLNKKRDVGELLDQAGQASYEQAQRIALGVSAIAAVLAIMVGFVLSRRVANAAGQVAAAAKGLARGEINQRIGVGSSDELGQMAEAFRQMIAYQQDMARVANAIARGDLTQTVKPKSDRDVLGLAFQKMSGNLRLLVGQLEKALLRAEELLEAKEEDARTIQNQVQELSRLLEQNELLHERLRRSAARTTKLNEQALRRIGADLHDGPGQALAFAVLRLETLADGDTELGAVKGAVQDALAEIRAISTGLRLPELGDLPLEHVIGRAVRDHGRRSGTPVDLLVSDLPDQVPLPVKIAAFRALQEALSNATRHGKGAAVTVKACVRREQLCLTVTDRGPGFVASAAAEKGGLGLASMRERAELLGGRFRVQSSSRGTSVHLRWPIPPYTRGGPRIPALIIGQEDQLLPADLIRAAS